MTITNHTMVHVGFDYTDTTIEYITSREGWPMVRFDGPNSHVTLSFSDNQALLKFANELLELHYKQIAATLTAGTAA